MRKIREVLRLSQGEGEPTSGGPGAVATDDRGRLPGPDRGRRLSWPLPDGMDDADLERRPLHPRRLPAPEPAADAALGRGPPRAAAAVGDLQLL